MVEQYPTCEIHVLSKNIIDDYKLCGSKAKFITPITTMNKKAKFVCGKHKNSIDKMLKRTSQKERCKLLFK